MIRPLILGTAVLIAGATQTVAQGVPIFNVEPGCRQVLGGLEKLTTFEKCMEDEKGARDDLIRNWGKFVSSDRRICIAETISDGTPSYVELLECLYTARDIREQTGRGRLR